ncbi:MarR family transcriptional regulator [Herbiconiux sp. CPCC 205716]|uniref:MarR family transcriptional regulator n=1 Tax=Herbiconiux gentiana TaxID=2970912 RepID=A0ABT2GGS8_9MICO|nr:MarR family transcriptional regulator [Herbiconiux gentiana]MCS5715438.1 MarR family transcriptional regulator [Herbiconiux gentiana]
MSADERPLHYRSPVVEAMTSLLTVWWSPRFQRDIVGEHGRDLSTIEIRMLWTLGSRGPSRGAELAEALSASAPSVSKAAAKLHGAGLVTREPSTADQRSHTLHLTVEGRAVAQRLYDVGDEMVTEIFASWPGSDVETLSGLLQRFADDSQQYARRLRRDRAD